MPATALRRWNTGKKDYAIPAGEWEIRAGASSIQNVRWIEHIGRGRNAGSSSEYQISGDFDADDLVRLGYSVAEYAEGRVGVTVTGRGRGFDVDNARIDLDLRNAAVQLPRDFWTLIANGDKLSKQFQSENFKYVPKFFAAAIIGENPQDFGLNLQPVSTYSN